MAWTEKRAGCFLIMDGAGQMGTDGRKSPELALGRVNEKGGCGPKSKKLGRIGSNFSYASGNNPSFLRLGLARGDEIADNRVKERTYRPGYRRAKEKINELSPAHGNFAL